MTITSTVFCLSIFPQERRELPAMRWPMAILFGMTLSLIYMLSRRGWGPVPCFSMRRVFML